MCTMNYIKIEEASTPPPSPDHIKVEEVWIPDIDDCTATEINNTQLSLPDKPYQKYESVYLAYEKWRASKHIKATSEDALIVYFKELSRTQLPSTLWSKWSALKTTVNRNEGIDISRYQKLKEFVTRQADGYKCKKTKVLSAEEIDKFITEAPDDKYLATKVALSFAIFGSCGRNELTKIMSNDVQHQDNLIIVTIPITNTIIHSRTFILEGKYARLVDKYESMRPSNILSDRFFINYRKGRYTSKPIGVNKFGEMPKKVAEYLKLPDASSYTGHCFRKTSAAFLANSTANLLTVKGYGQQGRCGSVSRIDIKYSIDNTYEIEHLIQPSVLDMHEIGQDNNCDIKVEKNCSPPNDIKIIKREPDTPDCTSKGKNPQLSLPDESRGKYELVYLAYEKWRVSSKIKVTSEDALLVYFKKLSRTQQPPTLWSKWSMLKNTLNRNESIDISRYQKLKGFLRKQADGYKSNKTKVLSAEEIDRFITDAPDDKHLATKVALIFAIFGACGRSELVKVKCRDVQHQDGRHIVTIPITNTKVHSRTFILEGKFSRLVKFYESLRPSHSFVERFFLNYQNGRCTSQPIGVNKFGGMPKQIAEYLKLSDASLYTGNSFRKTSAALLTNSRANLLAVKRNERCESRTVAESLIIADKREIITKTELDDVNVNVIMEVMVKSEYIEDE